MKNTFRAIIWASILFSSLTVLGQSHLGLNTEVVIPISPFSVGYGTGYGVNFAYRKFRMTKTLIIDASIGYRRMPGKADVTLVDYNGYPETITFDNVISIPIKAGLAWAFIPNASPYTQPYAGFEMGIAYTRFAGYGISTQIIPGLRVGWMVYINERLLLGLETKYTTQIGFGSQPYSEYTTVGDVLNHQIALNLSATVRLGR